MKTGSQIGVDMNTSGLNEFLGIHIKHLKFCKSIWIYYTKEWCPHFEGAFLLGGSAQKGRLSFVQLSENKEGLLTGWGCYGILLP